MTSTSICPYIFILEAVSYLHVYVHTVLVTRNLTKRSRKRVHVYSSNWYGVKRLNNGVNDQIQSVKYHTEEGVEVEFRPDHVAVRQRRDPGVVGSRPHVKRLNHLLHKRHLVLNEVNVNCGAGGEKLYLFGFSDYGVIGSTT